MTNVDLIICNVLQNNIFAKVRMIFVDRISAYFTSINNKNKGNFLLLILDRFIFFGYVILFYVFFFTAKYYKRCNLLGFILSFALVVSNWHFHCNA